MNWTVRNKWRAAIIAAITTLAVYQTPSCVMARETVPMGQMNHSVVGERLEMKSLEKEDEY